MEQTAVKKLELKLLGIISFDSEELRKKYKDAINQAKEMEKEQMQMTWNNAIDAVQKDKWESYDDFYNNNFKSE